VSSCQSEKRLDYIKDKVLRREHAASEGKAEQWLSKEMDTQLNQLSGGNRHFVRLSQEEVLTINRGIEH